MIKRYHLNGMCSVVCDRCKWKEAPKKGSLQEAIVAANKEGFRFVTQHFQSMRRDQNPDQKRRRWLCPACLDTFQPSKFDQNAQGQTNTDD
jgi:hypothetical protein